MQFLSSMCHKTGVHSAMTRNSNLSKLKAISASGRGRENAQCSVLHTLNDRQPVKLPVFFRYNEWRAWYELLTKPGHINCMSTSHHVVFLCTGNACRSQMAEGWMRHLAPPNVAVESAGIEAHGKNPRAIKIMLDAGIDISGQESTVIDKEKIGRAHV